MNSSLLKITFVPGLRDIVLDEINQYPSLQIIEKDKEKIYLEFVPNFDLLKGLRSVLNVFVVSRGENLNPYYVSNHKSVLGDLMDTVLQVPDKFKTFKLSLAGSDSSEVKEIEKFVVERYKLSQAEEADMEMYIGKTKDIWEVGVRLFARPLSLRHYRVANIKGGLNPTIAYSMNTSCNLENIDSYLNIFSGSGTLLVEAGLSNKKINKKIKLIGFDINGKSTALAVENIKKAGLIKSVQLKNADIFDSPEMGKFDVIASDLPFGMQISKDEDLDKLYRQFVAYSESSLNPLGTLVAYTSEYELLEKILKQSNFNIVKTIDLKVPTSVNAYIYPKIFVCKLK